MNEGYKNFVTQVNDPNRYAEGSRKRQAAEAMQNDPNRVSYLIPTDIKNNLSKYKENDDYSTRNALFQALRKKDVTLADSKVGREDFQGYDGMRKALNEAYGDGMFSKLNYINQSAGNTGGTAGVTAQGTGNLPGANTQSTLSILQRR